MRTEASISGRFLTAALIALLLAPLAQSQDPQSEKELLAITSEQRSLNRRLRNLRSKMTRLKARLLKDKREFSAKLLQAGLDKIEQLDMDSKMRAIFQDLERVGLVRGPNGRRRHRADRMRRTERSLV